jgi:putative ABC transport system permease protein
MNLLDIISLALRNLRQAKLRTALTVTGVVIGVAAIITMVSFGIGLQNNIIGNAFAKLDLFTVITVFGPSADELLALSGGQGDSDGRVSRRTAPETQEPASPDASPSPGASPEANLRRRILDEAAIGELARIEGVRYAVPMIVFQSYVRYRDRTERHRIGGSLASVEYNPKFKKFLAGAAFSSDSAAEVIVTENFLNLFGTRRRGRNRQPGPGGPDGQGGDNNGPFTPAIPKSEEQRRAEANAAIGNEISLLTLPSASVEAPSVFGIPLSIPGLEEDQGPQANLERHPFRIVGVLETETGINLDQFMRSEIYVPIDQARRFREANRDPVEKMGAALIGDAGYPRAEVRVINPTEVRTVQQAITKLGFNSFSLNNQIDQIRYVFLVVNGGLALLGGIALLVASFGIANTMIMSILERTREIGIMKAIGGSDSEIMRIFFFEASLIGLFGGTLGVLGGWGVDRLANFMVNRYIVKNPPYIEFFSIPWYLWAGAIAFAVLISLIAAIYPALRAARVDPIRALRHD